MRGQHHRVVASSNHHCCRKFVFDALRHLVQFSRKVHTISRREPGLRPLLLPRVSTGLYRHQGPMARWL